MLWSAPQQKPSRYGIGICTIFAILLQSFDNIPFWRSLAKAGAMDCFNFSIFEYGSLAEGGCGSVWTTEGALLMAGFATNRLAARYEAHKALFLLLLSALYRSRPSTRAISSSSREPHPTLIRA